MRELVREFKSNLQIRLESANRVRKNPQKDWRGEIMDLHRFVRDNIRYLKDIRGVETLHTPDKILELGYGDCDDKSLLLATMLESIGHPTRFVAVGFVPGVYSHVLVETKLGEKWVPLECTEPVNAGWEPKRVFARMVVHN